MQPLKQMDMKKFIVFLAAAIAGIGVLSGCDEVKINEKRLPETARTFIQKNFPHTTILNAEKEREDGVKQYNVRLADGTEIEFDARGNWESIECEFSILPEAALLPTISGYITENYPGSKAYKIDKKYGGYEVEITAPSGSPQPGSDIELIFNAFGEFVRESR